jgi:hypothetical protein
MEKFFEFSKLDIFGKKKCPNFRNWDIYPEKGMLPYHILKLASGDQKNNFQFVTIIFFIFLRKRI